MLVGEGVVVGGRGDDGGHELAELFSDLGGDGRLL